VRAQAHVKSTSEPAVELLPHCGLAPDRADRALQKETDIHAINAIMAGEGRITVTAKALK